MLPGIAVWFFVVTMASGIAKAHGPLHDQIASLSLRIEKEPGNAVLFLRRGELYRLHGSADEARADFERAARIDPALHEVHLGLAQLWLDEGRPDPALSEVAACLGRAPGEARALFIRAQALVALGRVGEAVGVMDRAIAHTTEPRPEHYLERARLIARARPMTDQALDRAVRGLDQGIARLGPAVTLSWFAVELETAGGRYDRALERLDEIDPQCARKETLLGRRGEILEAAGRWMEAQAAYTEALDAIAALPARVRYTRSIIELETSLRAKLKSTAP